MVLEIVNLSRMFRKSLLLIISQILTKINSLAKIKQGAKIQEFRVLVNDFQVEDVPRSALFRISKFKCYSNKMRV